MGKRTPIHEIKRSGELSHRHGLARALSKLGYCSRSQAEILIRAGRVRLNGAVRRDPETPVRIATDRIQVDGQAIGAAQKIYLAMNKPRGLVTTTSDEKGRDTVYSSLPQGLPWLAPVGRLDKASEGLLLFTNDSEWAARVTAPETHLSKTYYVQVAAIPPEELLAALVKGFRAEDGDFLRAKSVRILRSGGRNAWLEVILDEGKNREIRRMLEQYGMEVLRLVRVAIGSLELGSLKKGETRTVTAKEKLALDHAMRRK
ncbi:MAG TPA: pseudouridine synthase [Candidatus Acidoferrales bacterium]|jgi:23S rRNA pseudouridine2605 synthase|nr:pseudouridine synthase [Candidatus Acidoferrales bacterium]